ncbi:MAG: hypothetical protein RLZZ165_709 [Bacteroidota bacterium]
MPEEKVCFVITGFGKKTDFQTGAVYDLEKTYQLLLKPVFDEFGYRCFRTTELKYSGSIDVEMYYYILNADFVVADISTLNANALYELGVRHALRPDTTIIIAESTLLGDKEKNIGPRIPFDLGHGVIFTYKHDGNDIHPDEVARFTGQLKGLVAELIGKGKNDSPVYTYLPGLEPPVFTDLKAKSSSKNNEDKPAEEEGDSLSEVLLKAEEAKNNADYETAFKLFEQAMKQSSNDTYVTQRFALVTYKSKLPNEKDALTKALEILQPLKPDTTNDVETLGLVGAIYKRLYDQTKDIADLKRSLHHYQRGFYVASDYYNGVNTAFIMTWLSSLTSDQDEKITYKTTAKWIRQAVLDICKALMKSKDGMKRNDIMWIMQTKAECEFGLGKEESYEATLEMMENFENSKFNRDSFDEQMAKLKVLMGA